MLGQLASEGHPGGRNHIMINDPARHGMTEADGFPVLSRDSPPWAVGIGLRRIRRETMALFAYPIA